MHQDPEPGDVLLTQGLSTARRGKRALLDALRAWLPGQLKALVSLLLASGLAAAVLFPVLVAVVLVAVAATGLAYGITATRQMHGERARRRWAEINLLRERERALQVEDRLDVVALTLAGDVEARRDLHQIGRPEIVQALRRIQYRLSTARQSARPVPRKAAVRAPASPKQPDVEPVKRRRQTRKTERAAVKAQIDALADPTDGDANLRATETRKAAAAARSAAREADRLARDRRRRGLPATFDPSQPRISLGVQIGPTGVRAVENRDREPSPEEIADGRRVLKPARP